MEYEIRHTTEPNDLIFNFAQLHNAVHVQPFQPVSAYPTTPRAELIEAAVENRERLEAVLVEPSGPAAPALNAQATSSSQLANSVPQIHRTPVRPALRCTRCKRKNGGPSAPSETVAVTRAQRNTPSTPKRPRTRPFSSTSVGQPGAAPFLPSADFVYAPEPTASVGSSTDIPLPPFLLRSQGPSRLQ
jgi:hypothetical protein